MNKSFSGSFMLGTAIVLIGVLMLIRNVFNIHIPIFAMLASFGLIWLGVMMIRGNIKPGSGDHSKVKFSDSNLNYIPGQENYGVSFGSGVLNLQDLKPDVPVHLNVECSFGEMKIMISRDVPLQVNGSASFGSLYGPDLRSASFGNYSYMSSGYNPNLPGITIHARVSFGELRVFYL
jgi:predicted membrane protein